MKTLSVTSKDYFRNLKIIFYAMLGSQVVFLLVTIFLYDNNAVNYNDPELTTFFYYLIPFTTLAGIAGSILFMTYKINQLKKETDLVNKMSGYFSATIVKYSFLNGASIFSIVSIIITGTITFLIATGVIFSFFIMSAANKEKIIADLNLNPNEQFDLNDPTKIIANIRANK